ncbi:MAG: nicotinate-nucleotide adenylyltransferase [Nitrospira sp.]
MHSSHPDRQPSVLNTQPSVPQRLGLLGGSFNPIHNGHLTIAHHVLERMQLSGVLFIPNGDPPHKPDGSLAPAAVRFEMVRLAIADSPLFMISDIEMQRTGKSYSIDTIRALHHHYGPSTELFFVIGLDAFLDFPTWREPRELLKLCHFVVVSRPEQSFQTLVKMPLLPGLHLSALAQLDTGDQNRLDIQIPSGPGITCLAIPPSSTSASDIRWRIRSGLPLANRLPPAVESYILRYSLYQEDRDRTRI